VGVGDDETINSAYIATLLRADWGFWRTAQGTIDAAPKSLRWRTRARVGERVRWYELPEEIDHPDPDRR